MFCVLEEGVSIDYT